MPYIYKIVNDINDKIYIGQTRRSIEKRFKQHCRDAFTKKYGNRPLYAAMRKYGIEHFYIELIEKTSNPNEREKYWIEKLGTYKYGYNATLGGEGTLKIDRDETITLYKKTKNIVKTAEMVGADADYVSHILKENGISLRTQQEVNKDKLGKPVEMYSFADEYIQTFASIREAAQYLIDNNFSKCKKSTITQHISEVCRGIRKSAAHYKWKLAN